MGDMIRVNSFVCGGVLGGFVGVGDDGALDWIALLVILPSSQ